MEIYEKKIDFHIFSFLVFFNHDFILHIDFTHIATINTAADGEILGHTKNI